MICNGSIYKTNLIWKFVWQKKIGLEIIFGKKKIGLEIVFGQKKLSQNLAKLSLGRNFFGEKKIFIQNFGPKYFRPNSLVGQMNLSGKFFWPKKIWVGNFVGQNKVGSEIFLSPKKLGQNNLMGSH